MLKKILLAALILPFLTGCLTRYVQVPIDPRLTLDCGQPQLRGETWRDVAVLATEQQASIDECTARMRAIRSLPTRKVTP